MDKYQRPQPEWTGNACNALSVVRISALPTRNKDNFISSYAREQRNYLKQYALDGRLFASSWDRGEAGSQVGDHLGLARQEDNLGFGTPVLKPRLGIKAVKRRTDLAVSGDQAIATHHEVHLPNIKNDVRSKQACNTKQARGSDARDLKTVEKGRGRPAIEGSGSKESGKRGPEAVSGSEDEQATRLAERRERKRAKRSIMKPVIEDASGKENNPKRREMKRKDQIDFVKNQPGFALMHGLPATNIGKNRLTLERTTLRNTGVFQKGKASASTGVNGNHPKQSGRTTGFSEPTFLNQSKRKAKRIPSPDRSNVSSEPPSPLSVMKSGAPGDRKQRSTRTEPAHTSKAQSKSLADSKTRYNPAESIVWDIEQPDCVLSSCVNSGEESGTVVLNLSFKAQPPICDANAASSSENTLSETELGKSVRCQSRGEASPPAARNLSSPSLRPSESASQIGPPAVLPASPCLPNGASKYFNFLVTERAEPCLEALKGTKVLDQTMSGLPEPGDHMLVDDDKVANRPPIECDFSPVRVDGHLSRAQDIDTDFMDFDEPYCDLANFGFFEEGLLGMQATSLGELECDLDSQLRSLAGSGDYLECSFDDYQMTPDVTVDSNCLAYVGTHTQHWVQDYNNNWESADLELPEDAAWNPVLDSQFSEGSEIHWEGTWDSVYEDLGGANSQCGRSVSTYASCDDTEQSGTEYGSLGDICHGYSNESQYEDSPIEVHHFRQGRSLLYGLDLCSTERPSKTRRHQLPDVEADVARRLQRDHWLPQKL
ncbi:hypothetical protein B0H34DRAFT_793807 [Crassisporium funariophilum]|nr:hypothetical protein B0H34DRAFT_793807 [Crassisporium funariophilum]